MRTQHTQTQQHTHKHKTIKNEHESTIHRNIDNTEITKNENFQEFRNNNNKFTLTDILNDNNSDFNDEIINYYPDDKKNNMKNSKGKLLLILNYINFYLKFKIFRYKYYF